MKETKNQSQSHSSKLQRSKRTTQNPLFIVKNRGRDVEMVSKAWKMALNYLNPSSLMILIKQFWNSLIVQLEGFTGLVFLQKILEKWIEDLQILMENIQVLGKIVLSRALPPKA